MGNYCLRRKGFYFIAVFALLCVVAAPAPAQADFIAAGALLVTGEGQSAMVLLVKHHSRSWYEMPGGRRQQQSAGASGQTGTPETAYETAIRECHEETRGILSHEYLREAVDRSQKFQDRGFVYFVGRIDRIPADSLRQAPVPREAAFSEIADYAWVAINSVLASNDDQVADEAGRRIKLRPQLKPRLARARSQGWL